MKTMIMIMYDNGNDWSSNDYYDCIGRDDDDDDDDDNNNNRFILLSDSCIVSCSY